MSARCRRKVLVVACRSLVALPEAEVRLGPDEPAIADALQLGGLKTARTLLKCHHWADDVQLQTAFEDRRIARY